MRYQSVLCAFFILSATLWAKPGQFAPAQEATGFSGKHVVNLVRNPGFEQASHDHKRPKYWYPICGIQSISSPALAEFKYALDDADAGQYSAAIQSSEQVPKQPYWTQIVPVKGGTQYRLSARIKAVNCLRTTLSYQLLDRNGGRIWDRTAVGPTDTSGAWKEISLDVQTPLHASELKIRCGMNATGKVWFDEISLVEISVPHHQPFQGATYPCVKVHTPMQMDGKLDEWNGIEGTELKQLKTLTQTKANTLGDRAPDNIKSDLAAVLRACYDANCLYIAIDVKDNVFPHVISPMSKGDGIKFGIDTMGQRSQRAEHDDLVFGFAPQGDELACYKEYPTWRGINFPAMRRAVQETDQGAIYELAIPWRVLGIRNLGDKSTLDLSILVTDEDGSGLKWLAWGGGLASNTTPSDFGAMVLLPDTSRPRLTLEPSDSQVADGGCATFDVDVASLAEYADLHVSVTLKNATGEKVVEHGVDVSNGVLSVPFVFDVKELPAGAWDVIARLRNARGAVLSTDRASLQIVPYSETLARIETRADLLDKKAERLRELIEEKSAAGVNTQPGEVSLACAEHLGPFALYDSHMLRFQDMAAKEIEDLLTVVEESIKELEAGGPRAARWKEPDVSQLTVSKHGQFQADEKTVFLAGIMNQPSDVANTMPFLKKIGVNLIGSWTDVRFCGRDQAKFDHSRQLSALRNVCAVARQNNCRVDVLMGHGLPFLKWLFEQHPDLDEGKGHFIDYDISHPVARATWRRYYAGLAPLLAELPELIAYDLANEPKFPAWTKHTEAGYRSWLEARYQNIAALNETWCTSYQSFDECRPRVPARQQSPASWYDWCIYNRVRVTEFFEVLVDAIREGDEDILLHIKIVGEDMFFPGTQDNGVDRDMLMEVTEIQGSDVRPIPEALWSPFTAAIDWVGQNMAFDFMKSTRPQAPILDSEWHVTQTVRYRDHIDTPAEHMETALWLAHLHGMSANLTWYWSRENGPERKTWGDFARDLRGSFLVQPLVVNAYGQTMLELNSLSREVSAFPAGPRPVRFYYSRPSAIQDPIFSAGLWTVYGSANFLGRGLGFLNDRQIEAEEFGGCEVLVVPFARYTSDKVVESIEKFIERGGTVVLLGPDSLTLDPWGRKRNRPRLEGPDVHRIEAYQPSEEQEPKPGDKADNAGRYYLHKLMKVVEQVMPPAKVAIVGEDGIPSWGVETRTVLLGADRLVYAVNVSPDPIKVSLLVDGGSAEWLRGTEFKTSTDLSPLHPVLIRVRPDSVSGK